ncbi:decaprenyl-diphosphate synthase subunit 1-like, partial [Lingula anatina]|uniref:Decaprenyl-diphosphate synthase subunit 1-like n=1 Tax=Lingula anatina TaxID=7574 RepID=A0A1S3JZZ1_LINAN
MASRVCLKCRCTQILPSFKRNLTTGYLQSGQFCTFLLGFNRRHIQWSTRNNAVVNQGLPVFSKNVGAMKKDQHRQSFSHQTRSYSSSQHIPHIPEQLPTHVDPFKLVEKEVSLLTDDIQKELYNSAGSGDILEPAQYHFDGKGKSLRPMVVLLAAKACNIHEGINSILPSQQKIGMVAEMIHTASLVHDDVIDASETRRGKPSVFKLWGQRKAILTGDFILSVSSQVLARIGNKEVVGVMSLILDDLVRGEFMQLGSKEDEEKRFNHYLKKTYKKTASLIANSCKS